MVNALMIDKKDNVIVAIENIVQGDIIEYKIGEEIKTIVAKNDIQIYHKLAVKNIKKGDPVVKYGEHIGVAARDILVGEHVHVHNVENHREQL